jgi:uncharacterized protein
MGPPLVPLRQFVLKVHSRCDLACDHCYVYQGPDQSWRGQPMVMSAETAAWAARRIAEHARAHALPAVGVVLHGGEPLLAGPQRLGQIAVALRAELDAGCRLDLRIHTNGVRLDEEFCRVFAAHGIRVGLSIDGDRRANDRHRRFADGRSSYDQVLAAAQRLRSGPYRGLYAGLLATIDLANDPHGVYRALAALDPPYLDFLLPHATWDEPPPRPGGDAGGYADWLIAVFDDWLAAGRPAPVRIFDSILATTAGGTSLTEALGLQPSDLAVIETDGTYQQVDSLKASYPGAPHTGLSVFTDPLDDLARHPGITARQQGLAGLCAQCQACPVVSSCGGGLYPHRWRGDGTGFANPSVYCPDLLRLITHVRQAAGSGSARHREAQPRAGRSREAPATRPAGPAAAPPHALPAADFQALAAGFGGASSIARLAETQRSIRRALVAAVYQEAAAAGLATPAVSAAWELLTAVDRRGGLSLDDVLAQPYVRVWAVRCLQRLRHLPGPGGTARPAVPLATDLAHLGAIAAAAALRAGLDAQVSMPVLAGGVHLPTFGRLVLWPGGAQRGTGTESAPGLASVAVDSAAGQVTVTAGAVRHVLSGPDLLAGRPAPQGAGGPAPQGAYWQPVSRLSAPGILVTLEDTDPYRDCHHWAAAPRLTDAEREDWQREFRAAWAEITVRHPRYEAGLAAGLRVITPLAPGPAGRQVSATARQAFGAVAVARPGDPATLALLLIHEFQHVKLGALLDLYDLFDRADTRLFHAPWREDPRPLEGLLQGTYAHVAVTDFWRARQHAAQGAAQRAAADTAARHYAHWRGHTAGAVRTLAASGSLTPLGEQLVGELGRSLAGMGGPVAAPALPATRA